MKTKITIPEPCNENWNNMTPTEKGAFCSRCSKEVKDFTKSTDQEILSVIQNSENTICGHISTKQLNRTLPPNEINLSKWMIPFAASFSLIVTPYTLAAQNERMLMGEVAIRKSVTVGKMAVSCAKPIDTIPDLRSLKGNIKIKPTIEVDTIIEQHVKGLMSTESIDTIPKNFDELIYGDIKIEQTPPKVESTQEIIVSGLMVIEPIIKLPITSKDTIRLDTIPFKPQQNKTNYKQKNNLTNATAFPNPTSNWTTIKVDNEGLYNLSIFNSTGTIILKKSFFGTALKVNLERQPQGIYYISIINSEGLKSKNLKVIKTN